MVVGVAVRGVVALAAVGSLALTGCVSGADRASGGAEVDPAALQGELVFWDSTVLDTEAPVVRDLIGSFEEAYPDVSVRYENVPEEKLAERFAKAVQADSVPDVVRVPTTTTATLAKQGYLENLSGSPLDTPDEFLPAAFASAQVDDRLMGVPQTGEPVIMASSAGTMERAGVGVPSSWDEVAQQAESYSEPDAYPLQAPASGLEVLPFVYSTGGGMLDTAASRVNINDGPSVAGFEAGVALATAGALRPAAKTESEQEALKAFQDGKVGSIFTTPARLRTLFGSDPFRDGQGLLVGAPPAAGDDGPATAYLGYNVSVTSASQSPDASQALVAALTSASGQQELATRAGLVPTRGEVYEADEVSGDPMMSGYLAAMQAAQPTPMIARVQSLYGPIGQEWLNMVDGRTSPRTGANAIVRLWLPYLPEGYRD